MLRIRPSCRALLIVCCLIVGAGFGRADDEPLFSGPQVGEKLEPFKLRGVYDLAGKDVDFVTEAKGKPLILVFVHEANRPTIGLTRILMSYVLTRHDDGLAGGVVWLAESVDAGERVLDRVEHAMTAKAPTGVSVDGAEGPGVYGLNRNVQLTILVAKENEVTANFPLVQPSIQADLPKILKAIVEVAGGEVPKLEDLPGMREAMRARSPERGASAKGEDAKTVERLRPLVRKLIAKDASDEEVEAAAEAIDKFVEKNAVAKKELRRIGTTIVDSGKLEDYGTPAAQKIIRRWAEEPAEPPDEDKKNEAEDKTEDKSDPGESAPTKAEDSSP